MPANTWNEPVTDGLTSVYELKGETIEFKSAFQSATISTSKALGKILTLDGYIQSAQKDEHIYHESLVHPAMLLHPDPKVVFIGGGGEGATAREILKHTSVEKVIMCDLDQKVVEMCIEHLPSWIDGCDQDPRLEFVYEDAKAYIENYDGKFDVVIMDICDPVDAGPGIMLYTTDFYLDLKSKLNPGFVFATQSGPGGYLTNDLSFSVINRTLREAFTNVFGYGSFVPAFSDIWAFNLAFDDAPGLASPLSMAPDAVDQAVESRLTADKSLRYYDGITHAHMFYTPKYMREAARRETRIMSRDHLVFLDQNFQPGTLSEH